MPLSQEAHQFLTNEMCIDIQDLTEKINSLDCGSQVRDIYTMIENFFISLNKEDAEEEIQRIFLDYEHLFDNEHAYALIDPIRHAFSGFAYGGLLQLFTRQENEAWYPRVLLTTELKPNDIANLGETIEIYRGCSMNEHITQKYGQSWSTSKDVAEQFAYFHYQNQPWFNLQDRVVLQSKVPKTAIFYSKQECEFEIVVNVNLLDKVRVCP
ncbi:hypothetical protein L4Z64_000943 [Pseudomonas aeruginosa]|uniref:hypothetical protein n=1 Tax=Pseudomonas aeruginosa TaxID=287 RepID=UPI00117BB298|nr:hypothetical protein [Pseudomonas aeruginosa]EKV0425440.1 hypothetical protein [Pseudomonas aeruginosa]EKX0638098.1 hypothetical protein [Pseudomonas aeruginosa]MBA4900082.1 hypothetical protein [Pseudomonas aeruginosa]MBG4849746.1 hypothetical protein [Pseudomonas aeruginosa]MBH9297927.1 hypothetical protein [Pseudomonas aeruginosa]